MNRVLTIRFRKLTPKSTKFPEEAADRFFTHDASPGIALQLQYASDEVKGHEKS